MRNYVGIAVDPTTLEEHMEELLRLEIEGFREVSLDDAKVTLMLLRWTKDESPQASVLRSLAEINIDKEERSD